MCPIALDEMESDEQLQRRVTNFLWQRHFPGLRSLKIEARAGTITVRGKVRSFYEKQLCQHSCRRVAGVLKLIDEVEVVDAVAQSA